MLAKITGLLGCAVLFGALSVPGFARGKTNTAKQTSVTGCVVQGDEPNEYAVRAQDGQTYGIKNTSNMNIAAHMGHTVTVTGSVTPAKEKNKVSKSGVPEENMHMKATNITMVSNSCK